MATAGIKVFLLITNVPVLIEISLERDSIEGKKYLKLSKNGNLIICEYCKIEHFSLFCAPRFHT